MRRYIKHSLLFLAPLLAVMLYCTVHYNVNIRVSQSGDLSKLGGFGVEGSGEVRKEIEESNQPAEYSEKLVGRPDDATIINFGDSFSALVPSYHDFITSSLKDVKLYDMPQMKEDPFKTLVALLNRGYFEGRGTRVVILESAERALYDRIRTLDLENSQLPRKIIDHLEEGAVAEVKGEKAKSDRKLASFEEIRNWMLLQLKGSPVKHVGIDRELFSVAGDELYYYKDDLDKLQLNEHEMESFQIKLNQMYDRFASHGIELVIVVPTDKYTAYQDYIVDNKYPRKSVAAQISKLKLKGRFITAAPIVKGLVEEGVKDVYFIDDTHWSPIAAKPFGEMISAEISEILEH